MTGACTTRAAAAFADLPALLSTGELAVVAVVAALIAGAVFYGLRVARWRVAARIWAVFVAALFVVLWGFLEASCPAAIPAPATYPGAADDTFLALAIPRMMAALAVIALATVAAMVAAHRLAAHRMRGV